MHLWLNGQGSCHANRRHSMMSICCIGSRAAMHTDHITLCGTLDEVQRAPALDAGDCGFESRQVHLSSEPSGEAEVLGGKGR